MCGWMADWGWRLDRVIENRSADLAYLYFPRLDNLKTVGVLFCTQLYKVRNGCNY